MGKDNKLIFDLSSLLRLGDLDIRAVVKDNPQLMVGEYFNSLSEFINHKESIVSALTRISELRADGNDIQFITSIEPLLMDIGCRRLIPAADEIISIGKRGHRRFAADCAKKMLDDFNVLLERTMTAAKAKKAEASAEGDEAQFAQETQLLEKVLKLLFHEDATRKLRILAVDDAPSVLKTISLVLGDDYKVHALTNPAMVGQFLQQITPELFLLDYQMPELSGFDLVPIIRKFAEHKDTPVIFLTSMGTIDHVSAAYALGACDFIVKHFEDNVLREKVAKHIVRKKLL